MEISSGAMGRGDEEHVALLLGFPRRSDAAVFNILVALLLGACAARRATPTASPAQIRSEASAAWDCPRDAISVVEESPTVLRVSGCGRTAHYSFHCEPAGHERREDPLRAPQGPTRAPRTCHVVPPEL